MSTEEQSEQTQLLDKEETSEVENLIDIWRSR